MAESYCTYLIRINNRERVDVEKRNSQHEDVEELSGKFRWEKLEEITPLLESAQKEELHDRDEVKKLGESLFDILFDDGLRQDFVNFYKEKVNKGKKIRVQLRIDEKMIPEVAAIPWEFLCLPARYNKGNIWMGTAPKMALTRWKSGGMPRKIKLGIDEKLKIALVVSQPKSEPKNENDKKLGVVEYEGVKKTLEKLASNKQNRIQLLRIVDRASREEIDKILSEKPHIFHFIGHGRLVNKGDGEVGQIALVYPEDDEANWVDEDAFSELFARHHPWVLMLQACEGGKSSKEEAFTGIASGIIEQNIEIVVAMQYEVTNSTAKKFACHFYERLAAGDPVDFAVQDGRRTIALGPTDYKKRDFATPVIFMGVQDGYLFPSVRSDLNQGQTSEVFEPEKDLPKFAKPNYPRTEREAEVNISKLQKLLKEQRWKEADRETTRIIIEAIGVPGKSWVEETDIPKIKDELLEEIDRLWRENSDKRFGFSVQGLIWEAICESISPYDFLKAKDKFGKEVGWYEEGNRNSGEWILRSEINDNIYLYNQAKGFLPTLPSRGDEETINVAVIDALAKKLKCKQRQEELANE